MGHLLLQVQVPGIETPYGLSVRSEVVLQGSSLVRHLYIKEYSSSEEGHATIPKNCGLFVAGLPYIPHDNSEVLTDLFGAFGAVERVAVHPSQVCLKDSIHRKHAMMLRLSRSH